MKMQHTGDPKTDALIDKHKPELESMEADALKVAKRLEEGVKKTIADYRRLQKIENPRMPRRWHHDT